MVGRPAEAVGAADGADGLSHPNVRRVLAHLESLGCPCRAHAFAAGTRTSADAARAIGTSIAQIAKSIVFVAQTGIETDVLGELGVLVITSGANRVSVEKVPAILGRPIARADAAAVRRLTGYPIGGVPPIGHDTALIVLLDQDLLQFPEVWAAAGTPHTVFPIAPADLVRVSGGAVHDVRE